MSLLDAFPAPRPVTLAGREFAVSPLRVRDLAALDAALAAAVPDPLEGVPPAAADADPEGRPDRLRDLWESARAWPVAHDSDLGRLALATPAGRAEFLRIALRRDNDLDGLDPVAVAAAATPAEWAALQRAAWGIPSWRVIAAELLPGWEGRPGEPKPLESLVGGLAERTGWTYEVIGELPLPAFRLALRGGEPDAFKSRPAAGETPREHRARVRAAFGGPAAAAGPPAASAGEVQETITPSSG